MRRLSMIVLAVTLCAGVADAGGLKPEVVPAQLRCEYRTNPLGIQTAAPQFRWVVESPAVGACQTAYRILVASTQANLDREAGDLWDSGKVKSSQSLDLPYKGSALRATTKYYWKVGVWNQNNDLQWSGVQRFVTGKLAPSDWHGSWIESGQETKNAVYMRKTFAVSKKIAGAYLSICGLGAADVYVNGRRVSEELISTSPANFPNSCNKRTYTAGYSTYDLSGLLQSGDNCMGVVLGNAYYHSSSWLGQYDLGQVKLICDLDIVFNDGTSQAVSSDTTWKWSYGAIKYHDMRFGQEDLDMRDKMSGWSQFGFQDAKWTPVQQVTPQLDKGILKAKQEPPIMVYRTTHAERIGNDTYVFPEYLAGHVRFKAAGTNGTEISINNGKSISKFILSGDGAEFYEQRFNYQGTKQVAISGKAATISDVAYVSTAANIEETGSFTCNDGALNKLSKAGYQTARLMTMGGLGFDAEREKCGWGEDGKNALDVNIYATDMLTIGRKWMWDYLDRQDESGYNPSVIPMVNDIDYNGIWQGGALNYIAWNLYWQYGDKRILEESYAGMKKTMKYLAQNADQKHFMGWTLNEWVSAGPKPPATMTGTIQYYDYARTMAKAAAVLGNSEDAKTFGILAGEIRSNYNQAFWNAATGCYTDDSGKTYQAIQAMAAWFGMVPEGKYNLAVSCLKDMVVDNKYHPTTGFSATASLLGVLMRDYPEVAYAMLQQAEAPSFLSNVADGLCSENWVGGPVGWASLSGNFNRHVYEILAGIQPLEAGFKKIGIFPVPMSKVTEVTCHYDSSYGTIRSEWNKSDTTYSHHVTIPPNTTAIIGIPKRLIHGRVVDVVNLGGSAVWSLGKYSVDRPGITANGEDAKFIKFAVCPGTWQFTVTTVADKMVPSRVTGLKPKRVTSRTVQLQWLPAEDNSGVIRCYRIYRDGVKLGIEPEGLDVADRGIANSKSFMYQVSAVDDAGLEGEKSEALCVTILPAGPNDVYFASDDDVTSGSWQGVYGADGYDIPSAKAALPVYAQVSYDQAKDHVWAATTLESRGLQKPEGAQRTATCRYKDDELVVDFQITGGEGKSVAIYLLDWDNSGRVMRCDLMDGVSNEILDTREVGDFGKGKYLRCLVKGHVRLVMKNVKGPNAVLSGVFFNGKQ